MSPPPACAPLVAMENVTVRFRGAQSVHAVNGVSLTLEPGKVLGILGESGSGKSVTLKTLLRLLPESRTEIGGKVVVDGKDVLALGPQALSDYRGAVTSMIFQDPALALDPVYTIGEQIAEAIRRHERIGAREAMKRALELLELVRIPSPERRLKAYPHEMSGGMRQRAMIALALAARPKLLLADEPTTALDATVQIQILLLLRELQRDLGLSIIFVTHDLGAAVEVADRILVMYAGRIVEEGSARDLIRSPRHPYTIGLLKSRAHGALAKGSRLDAIPGSPPDLANLPPGCPFAPRCPLAIEPCRAERPPAVGLGPGRFARCIRVNETAELAPA
jgi:peptide/nickel transport system ATP-binding protein